MGRSTLIALLLAAVACGGESPPLTYPDGGQFCTAGSHTCPTGTRCANSYCTTTCTGGAACPSGTFCSGSNFPDDLCAPVTSKACALANDCPIAQTCFQGRCISLEVVADGGVESCVVGVPQDKCAPDAICMTLTGAPGCIGLQPCAQGGSCPAGAMSTACNLQPDGGHVVPGKGAVCLLAQCGTVSDCKAGALCAHPFSAVTYGNCQLGITGDPCASGADCVSAANCQVPAGGAADAGMQCKCVINTPDAGACAGK